MTRILLSEDDPGTAQEISLELAANGFEVDHHNTAAAGFNAAWTGNADLLMVDRQLPDGRGLT